MNKGCWQSFVMGCLAVWSFILNVPSSGQQAEQEVEALIEQLEQLEKQDYLEAYQVMSPHFLLGEMDDADLINNPLVKIATYGHQAIPVLLEHLEDARETSVTLDREDQLLGVFNYYDFNIKTEEKPDGVNTRRTRLSEYRLKVGDLCFLATGIIVNRVFARNYREGFYSSPVRYEVLKSAAENRFANFDKSALLENLKKDFQHPDVSYRSVEAYRRLKYFFPEQTEAIVLEELQHPIVDWKKAERFCRSELYRPSGTEDYVAKYESFILENGKQYKDAILRRVFYDLEQLEGFESRGVTSAPYGMQPRFVLTDLFDFPGDIESAQRPDIRIWSSRFRIDLLNVLDCTSSNEIDKAVKRICEENPKDPALQASCLICLIKNGNSDFVVARLKEMDFGNSSVPSYELDSFQRGQCQMIKAASNSNDADVHAALSALLTRTPTDDHFDAGKNFLERLSTDKLTSIASRHLENLPENTREGRAALRMVIKNSPTDAVSTIQTYLQPDTIERIEQVCNLFRQSNALSLDILPPLLADKREIPKRSYRVCDLAAQSINAYLKERRFIFSFGMSETQRDEIIASLIAHLETQKN